MNAHSSHAHPAPPPVGDEAEHRSIAVVGGGIGGLIVALCLDAVYNHPPPPPSSSSSSSSFYSSASRPPPPRMPIHVYESASAYGSNAGGAIGLYPNGLRVLRDISARHPLLPHLLRDVRDAGCEYVYRRWMRHDGSVVCVAREDELLPDVRRVDVKGGGGGGGGADAADGGGGAGAATAVDDDDDGGCRIRGGLLGGLLDAIWKVSSSFGGVEKRNEKLLLLRGGIDVDAELNSLGIRRWKYQKVLHDACVKVGIVVHFGKRVVNVTSIGGGGGGGGGGEPTTLLLPRTLLEFKDGTKVTSSLLIGADGINSAIRKYVANPNPIPPAEDEDEGRGDGAVGKGEYVAEYTGVTCLMGCASVPFPRGISFPSSVTTRCHACYYPTRVVEQPTAAIFGGRREEGEEIAAATGKGGGGKKKGCEDGNHDIDEMVFQIYFPSPVERPDQWRTLSPEEARDECRVLAGRLRDDGWDEMFLRPLESPSLEGVLRVGIRERVALDTWHVGGVGEVGGGGGGGGGGASAAAAAAAGGGVGPAVLLGDAAHPPVPYIGQGAMMATEDAGTLAMVLGEYCPLLLEGGGGGGHSDDDGGAAIADLDLSRFAHAMGVYESLRVGRVRGVLASSVTLGKTQQRRAESAWYNAYREASIRAQVLAHGTLPVMRLGAAFDYRATAEEAFAKARLSTIDG